MDFRNVILDSRQSGSGCPHFGDVLKLSGKIIEVLSVSDNMHRVLVALSFSTSLNHQKRKGNQPFQEEVDICLETCYLPQQTKTWMMDIMVHFLVSRLLGPTQIHLKTEGQHGIVVVPNISQISLGRPVMRHKQVDLEGKKRFCDESNLYRLELKRLLYYRVS